MNNIQQVLQQQCDYGEHEFTIAPDGKNCIKCKLHVAEQTELEEIVERVSKETNIAYDEYSKEHTDILRKALTSYAEVRVKEERERIVKLIDKCYPKYTHFDCTSSDCIECKEYKVADEALSKLLALTNKEEE